jgi:hypothetical protein
MVEAVAWIRQIPNHRNFQLLGGITAISIGWTALFVLRFVPPGLSPTVVRITLGLCAAVAGAMIPAVRAAESVGCKNALRFVFVVTAGAVSIALLWRVDSVGIGAAAAGLTAGYGLAEIARRYLIKQLALTVAWNVLLVTTICGAFGLVVSANQLAPQVIAGAATYAIIVLGLHQILANELGVSLI